MTPNLHIVTLVVLSLGVGWLMAMAGLQKKRARAAQAAPKVPVLRPPHRRPCLLDLRRLASSASRARLTLLQLLRDACCGATKVCVQLVVACQALQ
jgi:hypothetical protein